MSKLLERKSIRKYDPSIKISKEEMKIILTEATQAPSSMNMQPWRFVVIDSVEGKKILRPLLKGNQTQLETSAAMIIIFNDLKKYELADQIYEKSVKLGLMPNDVKEKQLRIIANMIPDLSEEHLEKSGMIDCGLVAMQLMHIAREHGYDTCPIGGFHHRKIAKDLGMDEKRYIPALIVSIGKKAEDGYPSVRFDIEDITTFI